MRLTQRQLEFLIAIGNGSTIRQVAESSCVEYATVRNCLAQARERLGAATTAQAVVLILASGEAFLGLDGYLHPTGKPELALAAAS